MANGTERFSQFGQNSGYVEELYKLFCVDPGLVGQDWASYFASISEDTGGSLKSINGSTNGGSSSQSGIYSQEAANGYSEFPVNPPCTSEQVGLGQAPPGVDSGIQDRVYRLVSAYRSRGHLRAEINPLSEGIIPLPDAEDLDLSFYNFSPEQLEQVYYCAGFAGQETMKLSTLLSDLKRVYCSSIGFEFTHLFSQEERAWLQGQIEKRFTSGGYRLTKPQKLRRLQKIIDAETFESELHRKYVGHKRFSLQGSETLIPMIDTLLEEAASRGTSDVVVGMPHRGRLNVLCNTLGKPLEEMFSEFEDQNIFSALGSGDVKYHMGYESEYETFEGGSIKVKLCPNPSHLEFVDPVVEGVARALQDHEYGGDRESVLPVLIHGDAAFVGQGVVYETLNLSNVEGYETGGTIHIIVNNQIGFTTTPDESRSTVYCTDFAKAILAPVLHINCENVEAACWAIKLACKFRQRYHRDIVLDLYSYRKFGHNEGDDPSFTQPVIYRQIKEKLSTAKIYSDKLLSEGEITDADIESYLHDYKERFRRAVEDSVRPQVGAACSVHGRLKVPVDPTGVPAEQLEEIAASLVSYPEGFTVHPKLGKILEKRVASLTAGGKGIDWGFAEALAFGSILRDGYGVRLSGQDSGRGTFSQRHLILNDNVTGEQFSPLQSLDGVKEEVTFDAINSTLSEAAVLGFEFGYSSIANNTLTLWEAQFGDFVNGAQVLIDQFLSSSEQKWNQRSGVVLLLPHGYEGQGPEHSSARLERFLQACADGNMNVAYPTTASQYFHLLRKQAHRVLKRPLIIMTPKSLLRYPGAACELSDITSGCFTPVLVKNFGKKPEHVVFTTGKIYYELKEALKLVKDARVRILRIERLYPFPAAEVKEALKRIKPVSYSWMQEEPRNMGAWNFIEPHLRECIGESPEYFGRVESASTATGSSKAHAAEQKLIIGNVLKVVGGEILV